MLQDKYRELFKTGDFVVIKQACMESLAHETNSYLASLNCNIEERRKLVQSFWKNLSQRKLTPIIVNAFDDQFLNKDQEAQLSLVKICTSKPLTLNQQGPQRNLTQF